MQKCLKYWLGFFFLMPVLMLLVPMFKTSTGYVISFSILTEYTLNTLYLVLGVSVLTLIFGVGSACVVTFLKFPGRSLLKYVLILPLAIPGYISALAYIKAFEFSGPIFTFLREVLGITFFFKVQSLSGAILIISLSLYPYIYILTLTRFASLGNFIAISRTCGKSFLQTMVHVAIPIARPSIVAGLSIVLMETVAEFGLTQMLGVHTLTTGIYRSWFLLHDNIWAARLVFIVLLFSFILIFIEKKSRKCSQYYNILNSNIDSTWSISKRSALLALLLTTSLPILGFFLPVLTLINLASESAFDYSVAQLIINSVNVAFVSSLITILLGLLVIYLSRKEKKHSVILDLSTFGYAVPGVIVAMGILSFLGLVGEHLNGALESIFSGSVNVMFIGTFFALMYSYSFRFLSLGTNTLQAGFDKVPKELEWNLKLMGKNTFFNSFNIFFPMLARSFFSGFILIFLDIIKELPATLIIRPFNFETMSTRVYELVLDERYYDAAVPALIITGLGVCSIVFLMRILHSSSLHKRRKGDKVNCLCEVCLNTRNECYN